MNSKIRFSWVVTPEHKGFAVVNVVVNDVKLKEIRQ